VTGTADGTGRLLIVNADDFGLTAGICSGILRAQQDGIVTSTTAIAVGLAVERGIPAIRLTRAHGWSPTSAGVRALSARLHQRVRAAGLAVTDDARGLEGAGHLSEPHLIRTVDDLGAGGARTAEIGTHPGTADDPDRARYRWGYEWPAELEALCSPAARQAVERHGFTLGSYADLVGAA
jgi:predicted glycoside hydrolase/deacetylase ChbG (UPF0249 family)